MELLRQLRFAFRSASRHFARNLIARCRGTRRPSHAPRPATCPAASAFSLSGLGSGRKSRRDGPAIVHNSKDKFERLARNVQANSGVFRSAVAHTCHAILCGIDNDNEVGTARSGRSKLMILSIVWRIRIAGTRGYLSAGAYFPNRRSFPA